MERADIIRMAREAGAGEWGDSVVPAMMDIEKFAALVAEKVHKKYNPIGTVAGGAGERTFMHPSVKFILPTGLQLYARIEVREEDKV